MFLVSKLLVSINLYVGGEGMRSFVSDESIFSAPAENEVLMDLFSRGVVTLELGSTDQAIKIERVRARGPD
jgi:hypothetical protein